MRTIDFNDEDIKECKLALVNQHITPLQSAFLLQYINNIEANLDKLEQENEFLKLSNPEMNIEHFRYVKENKRKIDNLRLVNKRLNNIINKGIEAINVYQNEKTLSVGYQDLKRIRGILQGNEFDLQMFEKYLQELKGSDK